MSPAVAGPPRPGARVVAGAALALVLAGAIRTGRGQDGPATARLPPQPLIRPEATLSALIGLQIDREIDAEALTAELAALARWRTRRDEAFQKLRTLYERQDATFNTVDEGGEVAPETNPEELDRQVLDQESLLVGIGHEGRDLRLRIKAYRQRLAALDKAEAELVALLPDDADSVTGVWDARLVPTGESGVLSLYQSGTLLSGEYLLSGGWRGSIEGTLVDGRVHMERIDARKGRFATLTGSLDPEGHTMRGTWRERDLTAGRPVEGSWIAEKRLTRPAEEP